MVLESGSVIKPHIYNRKLTMRLSSVRPEYSLFEGLACHEHAPLGLLLLLLNLGREPGSPAVAVRAQLPENLPAQLLVEDHGPPRASPDRSWASL